MMELNPNHKVVRMLHDQWHAIVAILVNKLGSCDANGATELTITLDDIRNCPQQMAISVQEIDDVIHLKLISMEEAERLARRQGGLPT
jgi:hypothetical protein